MNGLLPILKKAVGERKYGGAIRVMAAGIPNSGKSSFLNRMAGGKKAAVGDRPGITKGKQWVRIGKEIEILDLPGILAPKIEEQQAALNLAYTGAVKEQVLDTHALAISLCGFLAEHHSDKLLARYGELTELTVAGIAKARGMLVSGGELDVERAALALLDDFRSCRIGKITLEFPNNMRDR